LTARTYKLPQRTVALIEALGREGSRTRGGVLAACAGLLASDVEEAKEALAGELVAYRRSRERSLVPSRRRFAEGSARRVGSL
jgi:hypothetical protein